MKAFLPALAAESLSNQNDDEPVRADAHALPTHEGEEQVVPRTRISIEATNRFR